MDVLITPHTLKGSLAIPASKSEVHRLLIAAAMSRGHTSICLTQNPTEKRLPLSDDILSTCKCLTALGATIVYTQSTLEIDPIEKPPEEAVLDCGDSGSTLRFLLPFAAALCPHVTFTGSKQLSRRPISDLVAALGSLGVEFSDGVNAKRPVKGPLTRGLATAQLRQTTLPFSTHGTIAPISAEIAGDVSSQFVSGMLFAMAASACRPHQPEKRFTLTLRLSSKLESESYPQMTVEVLRNFGLKVVQIEDGWVIETKQRMHSPGVIYAESDWSNAAPFMAARVLNPELNIVGLNQASLQGDKAIAEIMELWEVDLAGADYREIDVQNTPDLFPVMAVMAAAPRKGGKQITRFLNTNRLRFKESNRVSSTAELLRAFGVEVKTAENECVIESSPAVMPRTEISVSSAHDHRIVMAATLSAHVFNRPVVIEDAEYINKSFPTFFDDYASIGGVYDIL